MTHHACNFLRSSLGTFVFTFVAQHAVHLVFQSLRPSCRNMENFEKASSLAAILSTLLSLTMGLFVYMTFWEATSSDMFNLYPSLRAVDICRLLLCLSMLLTYPFPFLTVRELIILLFCTSDGERAAPEPTDTTEPLIGNSFSDSRNSWLLPGEERQLKRNYHVALTVLIWSSTLFLAIKASSLGAVLNLTGCATGTGKHFMGLLRPPNGTELIAILLYSDCVHSSGAFLAETSRSYCPR
jgi:amino acid permease